MHQGKRALIAGILAQLVTISAGCHSEHEGSDLHAKALSEDTRQVTTETITVRSAFAKTLRNDPRYWVHTIDLVSPPRCLKIAAENQSPFDLFNAKMAQYDPSRKSPDLSGYAGSENQDATDPFYTFTADTQQVEVLIGKVDDRISPSYYNPSERKDMRYLVRPPTSTGKSDELCWMRAVFLDLTELDAAHKRSEIENYRAKNPNAGTIRYKGTSPSDHSYLKSEFKPSQDLLPTWSDIERDVNQESTPAWSHARSTVHDPDRACMIAPGATIHYTEILEERSGHVLLSFARPSGSSRGMRPGLRNAQGVGGELYSSERFAQHWRDIKTAYGLDDSVTPHAPACLLDAHQAWVFKEHFADWPE